MMHGYLAFDKSGELLVPFRTWQNTNTHEAHEKLSELFQYNIPERWSIAHLYQAVLNNEEHIGKVDFFTTLAGYVHWKLTGEEEGARRWRRIRHVPDRPYHAHLRNRIH